jgi:hypothetical protein
MLLSPLQMPVDQPEEKSTTNQARCYSRPQHLNLPLPGKFDFP